MSIPWRQEIWQVCWVLYFSPSDSAWHVGDSQYICINWKNKRIGIYRVSCSWLGNGALRWKKHDSNSPGTQQLDWQHRTLTLPGQTEVVLWLVRYPFILILLSLYFTFVPYWSPLPLRPLSALKHVLFCFVFSCTFLRPANCAYMAHSDSPAADSLWLVLVSTVCRPILSDFAKQKQSNVL